MLEQRPRACPRPKQGVAHFFLSRVSRGLGETQGTSPKVELHGLHLPRIYRPEMLGEAKPGPFQLAALPDDADQVPANRERRGRGHAGGM